MYVFVCVCVCVCLCVCVYVCVFVCVCTGIRNLITLNCNNGLLLEINGASTDNNSANLV